MSARSSGGPQAPASATRVSDGGFRRPDRQAPAAGPHIASDAPGALPTRSCIQDGAVSLDEPARAIALHVTSSRRDLLLLGDDGRQLAWWQSSGSADAPYRKQASLKSEAPLAQIALFASQGRLWAILLDARGALSVRPLSDSGFGPARAVSGGVDRRFAPAVSEVAGRLTLAYTKTVSDVMHTFVWSLGRSEGQGEDVTPPAHGAAAPDFVLGAAEPVLVAVDARAGLSPLLEVAFDASGDALPARVRTPVNQPYAPPLLRAVQLSKGAIQVAYTAVGSLAATAIGRVPLREASAPVALLPSQGYGALAFSAAVGDQGAVFAMEQPTSAEQGAARSIVVRVLDDAGQGELLPLVSAPARAPVLARGARRGEFVLACTQDHQVRVITLWCGA